MKRLVAGLAFLSSVAAFLVVVGGGLALLLIENSGERGAGALLAIFGAISFAAALLLLFAWQRAFGAAGGKARALTATLLAVLPPAALSLGALRFSGFPYGSPVPLLDWSAFAAGLVMALGALSVLVVGYERMTGETRAARPRAVHRAAGASNAEVSMQSAALRREDAFPSPAERQPEGGHQRLAEKAPPDGDDVRVTPVDLPSIGRFRRQ